MKVKIIFFILGLFFVVAFSCSFAQENPTILDVKVVGNTNVSESAIIAKIKVRPGQFFSQQLIDEDIKRLYATGFFVDVAVDVREKADGIIVLLHVQEAPYVSEVIINGSRVFREEKLQQWIKTKSGQFLDKWQLKTDLEEIKIRYLEKGYAEVVLDYELEIEKETNKAKVKILVNEGGRTKIRKINISGVEAFKKKRLSKLLKTRTKTWFRSGAYKEDVLKEDLEKIVDFYKRNGYLDVDVDSDFQHDEKGRLLLSININEGKQYKVGDVEIEGIKAFPKEELRGVLKLSRDDIFSYQALKIDTQSLQDFYFDRGYIKAYIETVPTVNPDTGLVDITYQLDEKDIHYVNKIEIKGNVKTKDMVIRRELKLHPGDKFDGNKIKRSRQRLENLGYFEEIDFDVLTTGEENKEDLLVRVKESKTGEFSFGAGYSSVDEFVGFIELSQRNFDIANPPTFTGAGQKIALRTEMGTTRNDYELSFTEPWIFGYPYLFGCDLYQYSRERERDVGYAWDEEKRGFAFRFGKELTEYNSLYLRTRFDKIKISNVADDVSQALQDEAGSKSLHAMKLTFARDKRDNIFDTTQGYYFNVSIENVGGLTGGDVDFIRQTNQFSQYYSLRENWVLNFRIRSGIIDVYDDTSVIPLYERFFVGGAYSVRGYDERSIGPKDSVKTTDPVGGEAMLVGNIELNFPVYENITGAVFYDVGNVWAKKSDFASSGYKSSVGVGVRLKTPIGPIKLDYGYGLDTDPSDPSGKLHFSMGHKF
ncbi:MAG: outer membrane protein assembly factor BamA [Candidatus Saelkia tenebricola]|nr:outer membrane protein assembly factor BamA [Candidatus Saelkia tenebricola]